MATPLRIAMIGLDTSHVTAFTRLLNDESDEHHVPGGRVVAGYPGGTRDWDKSWSRVEGFTKTLAEEFGVVMHDSPKAAAEAADLVFIEAVDGRVHRSLFEQTAPLGKPTFIDKPLAISSADATAMIALAQARGFPLMSCSALRYAEAFTQALADDSHGPINGIDVFGPMALDSALPGLFWYGCHSVEMVVTAMGVGCCEVSATTTEGVDVFTMRWEDGRVATMRGGRDGHAQFGATIHRENGFQTVDVAASNKPFYASMLEAIMRSLPQSTSDVPAEQMLEIIRIMEAGNQARETDHPIALARLLV